ncbi:MAG TPA: DUF1499 domain-containing protein [Dongiaceae bacterium]|nr:DUF1499 domain-containing protein [Dongiaceae bacterium]
MKRSVGHAVAALAARSGLGLAGLAGLAAVLAGLGYRWGWWGLGAGFATLRWAVYGALAAAALSLVGGALSWRRRRWRHLLWAVPGLLLGLAVAAGPLAQLRAARDLPAIHDIATDTDDPPAFDAILKLRAGAPNSADYGGPVVAAAQASAYPDIAPADFAAPPDRVFAEALEVARALGWEVVAADPAAGRIEATDTTVWFGFKDDVVVRVVARGGGTRVDLRSASRIGLGDLGTNAGRVRGFLGRLTARLAAAPG